MVSIIYFYTESCNICKKVKSEINYIEKLIPTIYVNGENDRELVKKYAIEFYPTIVVLENDELKTKYIGKNAIKDVMGKIKNRPK